MAFLREGEMRNQSVAFLEKLSAVSVSDLRGRGIMIMIKKGFLVVGRSSIITSVLNCKLFNQTDRYLTEC